MFQIKSYHKAETIKQAIQLLNENVESRLLAGGTDVLIKLREGKEDYAHLVDINGLPELRKIRSREDETLEIGSGVTFTQAIESDVIKENIPILALAASTVGGPQVRNVATIGGNICNGVTSADSAAALLCLNTVLELEGTGGTRQIPIADFYLGPGKVDLKQGEILKSFLIKKDEYQSTAGYYYKYAMRNAMDIATIGCASICRVEEGKLVDFRLAFGVAAPTPIRCKSTESSVVGQAVSTVLIQDIEKTVVNDVSPRTSWRASKEFRIQIIKELAGRVATEAITRAGGKL